MLLEGGVDIGLIVVAAFVVVVAVVVNVVVVVVEGGECEVGKDSVMGLLRLLLQETSLNLI